MPSNHGPARPSADSTPAADEAGRQAAVRSDVLARLEQTMKACEALGDDALARHAGRQLFAAVACAADALLRDGGEALHGAPDKIGAFFDKTAAGFVQAVEGMHRRAVLAEGAAVAGESAFAAPRATHPMAPALAAWRSAAGE